jgi:hypothetical protein
MDRQRLAQLHVSPLRLQQGLFTSLALLVTLVGGQQFQRWDQHPQEVMPRQVQHSTQTHFSPVSGQLADAVPVHLMDVDQAPLVAESVPRVRWVF